MTLSKVGYYLPLIGIRIPAQNKANSRAQLNPNRWDSTQGWMKFDIVTQWVTAHSESYAPFCRACPGIRENGLCSKTLCGACSGAEYPYTNDCPSCTPTKEGRYNVTVEHENKEVTILAAGDVSQAINVIGEALPNNCGPTTDGTAEDMA